MFGFERESMIGDMSGRDIGNLVVLDAGLRLEKEVSRFLFHGWGRNEIFTLDNPETVESAINALSAASSKNELFLALYHIGGIELSQLEGKSKRELLEVARRDDSFLWEIISEAQLQHQ